MTTARIVPSPVPRIAPLSAPYASDVQADFDALMPKGMPPIGLFRTLARNPRVLNRVRHGGLLDKGSVSLRARELTILRTTALCRAEYEWGVHATFFGGAAGFGETELYATVHGTADDPAFTPSECAIVRLCDSLHESGAVSDGCFKELAQHFDDEQIIELVTLAGFYHTISFLVNVTALSLEPAARRFPQRV